LLYGREKTLPRIFLIENLIENLPMTQEFSFIIDDTIRTKKKH